MFGFKDSMLLDAHRVEVSTIFEVFDDGRFCCRSEFQHWWYFLPTQELRIGDKPKLVFLNWLARAACVRAGQWIEDEICSSILDERIPRNQTFARHLVIPNQGWWCRSTCRKSSYRCTSSQTSTRGKMLFGWCNHKYLYTFIQNVNTHICCSKTNDLLRFVILYIRGSQIYLSYCSNFRLKITQRPHENLCTLKKVLWHCYDISRNYISTYVLHHKNINFSNNLIFNFKHYLTFKNTLKLKIITNSEFPSSARHTHLSSLVW